MPAGGAGVAAAIMTGISVGAQYTAVAGVIAGAMSLGMTVASQAMRDEPDMPSSLSESNLGGKVKHNTRNSREFLPVVYGKQKVGSNDVFIEAQGEDNENLWIVSNLAEGECEGIEVIDSQEQVLLDDEFPSAYDGNVSYWFQSGASDQTVEPNINSAIPKYTDNARYTCRIVWRFTYDKDYFQQVPKRNVVLKGKRVYDFRDSTTDWSRNPVLALYDYMTNARYGLGIDASAIDTTSWSEVANYCDTKGWTLDLAVTGDDNAWDVIQTMLDHFRGTITWWDGIFYLRYADLNNESSVKTLTDEHLSRDADGRARISVSQPGRLRKPDGLKVSCQP